MFKTQLCLHFTNKGACWYGDQCNFAHGKGELRKPAHKPAPVAHKPAPKPAPVAPKPAPKPAPVAPKPAHKPAPVAHKPAPAALKSNSFAGFTFEFDETDDETETKFSWANEMENDFTFMNAICRSSLICRSSSIRQ